MLTKTEEADRDQILIYLSEYGGLTYEDTVWCFSVEDDAVFRTRLQHILTKQGNKWVNFTRKYPWEFFLDLYEEHQIVPITINDPRYPLYLSEIYQPPLVLFSQGKLTLLDQPALSVVGSRQLSTYGKNLIHKLVPALAQKLIIVSGMAAGADSQAHLSTIHAHGQTIGVIGTGLTNVYPRHNGDLQAYMGKHQLLVSPLPNLADVRKWHFPYRNRVIAGLSQGCLVVQAAKRSGSLITANYALQENRNVYASPASLFAQECLGNLELIQAGAKLVCQPSDILEDYI
ncbi:DNA-processing protein DprA [Aerococcus kribbianus]|uniref:DNA-processing protein DprA n=1 Tax=Aerococcus kribbianus TaxID=2999064 RepID=A0A9X3JG34_9LACT|nr:MULTISPECIES: DNA-processing protein DprA [unclassified Aerococcus]MCZ0716796.1 DNA-processing protein DprA [Aerococcus sp. YH-aer221]MCZ0725084.1 DNA-processing protein DprA [Aerococcus sp. YH-aer222]